MNHRSALATGHLPKRYATFSFVPGGQILREDPFADRWDLSWGSWGVSFPMVQLVNGLVVLASNGSAYAGNQSPVSNSSRWTGPLALSELASLPPILRWSKPRKSIRTKKESSSKLYDALVVKALCDRCSLLAAGYPIVSVEQPKSLSNIADRKNMGMCIEEGSALRPL